MTGIQPQIGTYPAFAATVALAVSIVLLLVPLTDLLASLSGPGQLPVFAKAVLFPGLLSPPIICCTVAWPIHLRQKRRDARGFGWLRFAVLASAAWMWLVFEGIASL